MRSLAFNSVENEFCEDFGGSQDLAKWRVNNADRCQHILKFYFLVYMSVFCSDKDSD